MVWIEIHQNQDSNRIYFGSKTDKSGRLTRTLGPWHMISSAGNDDSDTKEYKIYEVLDSSDDHGAPFLMNCVCRDLWIDIPLRQ